MKLIFFSGSLFACTFKSRFQIEMLNEKFGVEWRGGMQKVLYFICFGASIALFGWTLNDYATSGEQVFETTLEDKSGSLKPVMLDPSMSPMRLLLKVQYEITLRDLTNNTYVFDAEVKDPAGDVILSGHGAPSKKKDDKGSITERNSQNHVVGSFDVVEGGAFLLSWNVKEKRATINGMSMELRRNVSDLNVINLSVAGLLFVLGWIIIFTGRRKTKG